MSTEILKIAIRMTNNQPMFERVAENIRAELQIPEKIELIFCSSDEEFASAGPDVEVAACFRLNEDVFSMLPGLKWIHFAVTGIDHAMYKSIISSDIIITKSIGFHSKVTAEYAFAMILYFERKLGLSLEFKSSREWIQKKIALQTGTLSGKTLGILGQGAIGREVAQMAKAFGMNVIVTTRTSDSKSQFDNVDASYPLNELEDLMSISDYFAICAPLTDQTRGLIDAKKLSRMKESAILINIARGAIVDEKALYDLLVNKKIAGAGIDVYETEPLPEESPFFKLDNVFMSPHVAGNFAEYTPLAATNFGINLDRYMKGKELNCVVDKSLWY